MSPSNTMNSRTKQEKIRKLRKQYGNTCMACKQPKHLTLDHIIPIVDGGGNDLQNLQLLCYNCNQEKGDATIDYKHKMR